MRYLLEKHVYETKIKPSFFTNLQKKVYTRDPRKKFLVKILVLRVYMTKSRFFSKKKWKKK